MIQLLYDVDNQYQISNAEQLLNNQQMIILMFGFLWNILTLTIRRGFSLSQNKSNILNMVLIIMILEIYLLDPRIKNIFILIVQVVLCQNMYYNNRATKFISFPIFSFLMIIYTISRILIYEKEWTSDSILLLFKVLLYQFFGFSISLRQEIHISKSSCTRHTNHQVEVEDMSHYEKKVIDYSKMHESISFQQKQSKQNDSNIQQLLMNDKSIMDSFKKGSKLNIQMQQSQQIDISQLEEFFQLNNFNYNSQSGPLETEDQVSLEVQILKNTSPGIVVFNTDRDIIFKNKSILDYFNLSIDEQNKISVIKENILNFILDCNGNQFPEKRESKTSQLGTAKTRQSKILKQKTSQFHRSQTIGDNTRNKQIHSDSIQNTQDFQENNNFSKNKLLTNKPISQKNSPSKQGESQESLLGMRRKSDQFVFRQNYGADMRYDDNSMRLKQNSVVNYDEKQQILKEDQQIIYEQDELQDFQQNDGNSVYDFAMDNSKNDFSKRDESYHVPQNLQKKNKLSIKLDPIKLISQKKPSIMVQCSNDNEGLFNSYSKQKFAPTKVNVKLKKNILENNLFLLDVLNRQHFTVQDILDVLLSQQQYFSNKANTAKSEKLIQPNKTSRDRIDSAFAKQNLYVNQDSEHINSLQQSSKGIKKNYEIQFNKILIRTTNKENRKVQITISSFIKQVQKVQECNSYQSYKDNLKESKNKLTTSYFTNSTKKSLPSNKDQFQNQKEIEKIDEEPLVVLEFMDIEEIIKCGQTEELTGFKERMLCSLSHELRTPLNCSIQLLEMMSQSEMVSKEAKQMFIKPALNSNELLLHIINDILDFAQITQGDFNMQFTPFKINKVLQDCISLFTLQTAQKGIPIELHIDQSMPQTINSDCTRFRQIVLNLLSNAIKFSSEGSITIHADYLYTVNSNPGEDKRNLVKISISDMGCGISPEIGNKIFEGFSTTHHTNRNKSQTFYAQDSQNATDRDKQSHSNPINSFIDKPKLNTSGAGLGLTISNNLAKGLGANRSIEFISEVGKGSTFSFYVVDQPKKSRGCRMSQYNMFNMQFTDWRTISSESREISYQNTSQTHYDSQISNNTIKVPSQSRDSLILNFDVLNLKKIALNNSNSNFSQNLIAMQQNNFQSQDTDEIYKKSLNRPTLSILTQEIDVDQFGSERKIRNDHFVTIKKSEMSSPTNPQCLLNDQSQNDSCDIISEQNITGQPFKLPTNSFDKVVKGYQIYLSQYPPMNPEVSRNISIEITQQGKDHILESQQQQFQKNKIRHNSLLMSMKNQRTHDSLQSQLSSQQSQNLTSLLQQQQTLQTSPLQQQVQFNPLYSSHQHIQYPQTQFFIPNMLSQQQIAIQQNQSYVSQQQISNKFMIVRKKDKKIDNLYQTMQSFLTNSMKKIPASKNSNSNSFKTIPRNSTGNLSYTTNNTNHLLGSPSNQSTKQNDSILAKKYMTNSKTSEHSKWNQRDEISQMESQTSVFRDLKIELENAEGDTKKQVSVNDVPQQSIVIPDSFVKLMQVSEKTKEEIVTPKSSQKNAFSDLNSNESTSKLIKECETPIHNHCEEKINYKQMLISLNENPKCQCKMILIVDDTEFNLYALEMRLKMYKFNVDKANSGTLALKMIQDKFTTSTCCKKYSLIFMDIDMPIKNGHETTKDIIQYFTGLKQDPPPISACTAFVNESEKLKAKQSGMKYYITKPIDSTQMEQVLAKIFLNQ